MLDMEHLIDYWESRNIVTDKRILDAIRAVPRTNFLEKEYSELAHRDEPLPILADQTISQPTAVVSMLEALELKEGHKVLEIGTGSGWNAALMAHIVGKKGKIYTTEIIQELVDFSKKNIAKTDFDNIKVIYTDGGGGYPKAAPYDRIIITAACPKIPYHLKDQLKDNGIILAPVGSIDSSQKMIKMIKKGKDLTTQNLGEYRFVPLTGKYGYEVVK